MLPWLDVIIPNYYSLAHRLNGGARQYLERPRHGKKQAEAGKAGAKKRHVAASRRLGR